MSCLNVFTFFCNLISAGNVFHVPKHLYSCKKIDAKLEFGICLVPSSMVITNLVLMSRKDFENMVIHNNQVMNQTVPQPSLKVHYMSHYGEFDSTYPNTQVR